MLTITSQQRSGKTWDGVSRRNFLKLGGLRVGGLTLADLLRLQARGATVRQVSRAVIMVWLEGGPSHLDRYDLKPDAPAEIRGPFKPIRTKVPGMDLCKLFRSRRRSSISSPSSATSLFGTTTTSRRRNC